MSQDLICSVTDGIARMTINRPAARNAMTLAIGKLMPGAALRSLAPVLDWRPPPGPTPSSS